MTTVLKVHLADLTTQFIQDLRQKFDVSSEFEIRVSKKKQKAELFSDTEFWHIIAALDGSKTTTEGILAPAVQMLADMPVVNIYLFADKLAQKLYQLDTKAHGVAYLANETDDYLSVDDFLYVRCAVVSEGKTYFEHILKTPSELSSEVSFEPLLNLADHAYKLKTGKPFNYHAICSYETYSNKEGWQ
jgi:Protein of unknown function (DUF4240)